MKTKENKKNTADERQHRKIRWDRVACLIMLALALVMLLGTLRNVIQIIELQEQERQEYPEKKRSSSRGEKFLNKDIFVFVEGLNENVEVEANKVEATTEADFDAVEAEIAATEFEIAEAAPATTEAEANVNAETAKSGENAKAESEEAAPVTEVEESARVETEAEAEAEAVEAATVEAPTTVEATPAETGNFYTYMGRSYSEADVTNLARMAWFEEGNAGKEATQLAAAVIINRSHWTVFGSNIYDVFYQPGQYAAATKQRYESSESVPDYVSEWIRELLLGNSQFGTVPRNVVFQAQFQQGDGIYYSAASTYICYCSESLLGEYIP